VLFRSMDNGDDWPEDLAWRALLPDIEIVPLPGTHFTVIADANLPAVRARLLEFSPGLLALEAELAA
jgi:thioesterase domain-containing protein